MNILSPLLLIVTLLNPVRLRTDLMTDTDRNIPGYPPIEIRSSNPNLGWELAGGRANTLQTAYRILVASSPEKLKAGKADIWDSGTVSSGNCTAVRMEGTALNPGTRYWWTVRVTDNYGKTGRWARACSFKTAAVLDGEQPRYPVMKTPQLPVGTYRKGDVFLADFGKDEYGQIDITISSRTDTVVRVILGEKLSDGVIDRKPGGTIRCCSHELNISKGTRTYRVEIDSDARNSTVVPGRSYNPVLVDEHLGGEIYPFRYCEVDGVSDRVKVTRALRYGVSYPADMEAGSFCSSDGTLDAVWELCRHTMKASSALGVFIDGDRERIPYEADALINQLSWYSCTDDRSIARYSVDYLCRNATWPTEWILQACMMAWNDYMYTGDTRLVERNYDILKARTLHALRDARGLISTRTGLQTPALMRSIGYAGNEVRDIVDWPQSGATGLGKEEAGEADGFVFTEYNAVVNAFHYKALISMKEIAGALGREEDARMFEEEAALTLQSFNKLFWNGRAYVDGIGTGHCSLHASMMPLAFGMVPEDRMESVLEHIQSRGMACSVYGAQFLLEGLYYAGAEDYALSLLNSRSMRSWYHMIEIGSTMTLEAWDSKFKPNLDWNHAWGAAPANIIQRKLMGIEPLEPGFKTFSVRPRLGSLTDAQIRVPTPMGQIWCRCRKGADGTFDLQLRVPANCRASIELPDGTCTTVGSGRTHMKTR